MITLKKESTKTKDVAVVGSGIIALMTTLELLKRGHRVNLYCDKLPIRSVNGKKQVQSAAGLQFWYNGDYDNCDPLKHELISKLSYDFLRDSLKSNRYQSLSWANVYATGSKAE
jgi:glycine/D-amino acid oxidase-like deaminating enzyme